MTETIFGQIGPYVIERPIGQGGMAAVFLARDTRVTAEHATHHLNGRVALKVVHLGSDPDDEAREILESEQRGAELQKRFSAVSRFVPKVFDSGFTQDYYYIAMEYIAGEDLAMAIRRSGRLPWQRAVVITAQLCEFLEDADRFEAVAGSRRVLLHNDLKPRNIRLATNGSAPGADAVKVLDFGAAKALSLSRKVTRNDFGSTAYLSPECLESGDRDLHSDAWALGVLLYEMVRGRQPFRADDTRRLEQLIRSRLAPESIAGYCPPALEAVIAKMLAPYPADRYGSPAEIRADLERAQSGVDTHALRDGWLDRDGSTTPAPQEPAPTRTATEDEPPTRRTHTAEDTEPLTRRTAVASPDEPAGSDDAATRRTGRDDTAQPAVADAVPVPPAPAPAPVKVRRSIFRVPRVVRLALLFIGIGIAMNEGCVSSQANRLAATVPIQDFAGLAVLWPKYEAIAERSVLGAGVARLEQAIAAQTLVLSERVMANYRTPQPTVRENQWKAARDALARAVALAPGDKSLRAALRVADGHLYRINGEARKRADQAAQAQEYFTEAVVAFREATELRPSWPDPFLGLARTFIYGLEDVDRGADALAQAEKNGHHPGERETTQLADGYRARGETLWRTAVSLKDMPQERDYLTRASEALKEALTRYSTVSGYGNAATNIRETQRRLERVEARLTELSKRGWWPWD
jgi:serine/threonine protein kinase/tetratricopeptide (TPR) repeat protein